MAEPGRQFRRIQHAQRPECLELAPTAAAQWRLMDATENLRKNDSAKPWQRRDPGRNLHVGCAAQTVGPRRNLPEHMALQPHTNPRCGAPAALPVLARRPRRAAGSSGRLLREPRCRAPVRPRRADMWTRRADKANTNKNTQWPPKTSRNGPQNFTTARRSDVDLYIFRS